MDSVWYGLSQAGFAMLVPAAVTFLSVAIILIFGRFGIGIYTLNGSKMQKLEKKVVFATSYDSENRPSEYIFGKFFIGKITKGNTYGATIIASSEFIKTLNLSPMDQERPSSRIESKNCITLYNREGTYTYPDYTAINFYPKKITPRQSQIDAVDSIIEAYNKEINDEPLNYSVNVLHGPPGTGKSSIAMLLCQRLLKDDIEVICTYDFNPIRPGDDFNKLYNRVEPTKNRVLVVILEEFDTIIKAIVEGKVHQHDQVPTLMTSKTGWNTFFDAFDRGQYRHVHFIMTTNKDLKWFDDIDDSLLRDNRITLKREIVN